MIFRLLRVGQAVRHVRGRLGQRAGRGGHSLDPPPAFVARLAAAVAKGTAALTGGSIDVYVYRDDR